MFYGIVSRVLLSYRDPGKCKVFDGMTPLYAASRAGKTETARILLGQADIDVNRSTSALYDAFWTKVYKDLGIKSVHLLTREGLESLWKTIPNQDFFQAILGSVLYQGKWGTFDINERTSIFLQWRGGMGVVIDDKIKELLLGHALNIEGCEKGQTALGAALECGHLDTAGVQFNTL